MRSDAHNELQDIIKERYQAKGWIAIKEHFVKGKKIDVLAQNKETKHTIGNEVQLGTKHYKQNILLDLRAGCDEVWTISVNKKVSDRIKKKALQELDKNVLGKTKFLTIKEFIPP